MPILSATCYILYSSPSLLPTSLCVPLLQTLQAYPIMGPLTRHRSRKPSSTNATGYRASQSRGVRETKLVTSKRSPKPMFHNQVLKWYAPGDNSGPRVKLCGATGRKSAIGPTIIGITRRSAYQHFWTVDILSRIQLLQLLPFVAGGQVDLIPNL